MNERGQGLVQYAVILFLVLVVAVIVGGLVLGNVSDSGSIIRDKVKDIEITAEQACYNVCFEAFSPGKNFENDTHLQECYDICNDK